LPFEMAEVMSDFHGELNDVLSKVNSWALGKEKELLSLQAEHTSFLDTHKGVLPSMERLQLRNGGSLALLLRSTSSIAATLTELCMCRYDDGAQAERTRGQGQARKADARYVVSRIFVHVCVRVWSSTQRQDSHLRSCVSSVGRKSTRTRTHMNVVCMSRNRKAAAGIPALAKGECGTGCNFREAACRARAAAR